MQECIGLMGEKGAGKSTAATYLASRHGFLPYHFARPLKEALLAMGAPTLSIIGSLEEKEEPQEIFCGKSGRHVMQTLGTEWGRELIGQDFWVNLWKRNIRDHAKVVTDDVRFENEIAAVRTAERNFIIYFTREAGHQGFDSHPSETIGPGKADLIYHNSGTLEDLYKMLDGAVKHVATRSEDPHQGRLPRP